MPFFRTMAGHIVGIAIPLFVRLNGGGDFLTSVLQSAYAMMYIFSPILLGGLAKRLGRRAALLIGSGLTIVDFVVYVAIWNITTPLLFPTIVFLFFLTRLADATWNGLYWPVIESRITDEKSSMSDPYGAEIYVKRFNLSWNAGIVLGNSIAIVASLAPSTEGILAGLYIAICIALVSVIINFTVGVLFFRNVASPLHSQSKTANPSCNPSQASRRFSTIMPSLIIIFVYGFTLQQQAATTTNLFTAKTITGWVGFSVVSLIPLMQTIRFGLVGISSAFMKMPKNPEKQFPRILLTYAGLMGAFSFSIGLLINGNLFGIVLILLIVAGIGWISGYAYCSSLLKVIMEGESANTHWFTALFETMQSLGVTMGGLISGAITEIYPYWEPPLLNLAIILVFLIFLMRNAKK